MDAWSITHSADLSSMGWQTAISFVNGKDPGYIPPCGTQGDVGQTVNSMGALPQDVRNYSEAKKYLQTGAVKTAFSNVSPRLYLSIPASRQQQWAYMTSMQGTASGSGSFPGVLTKQATDDFGVGGWKACDIIDDLINVYACTFEMDQEIKTNYNYDVSYWRVDPYSNILTEFKRLFSGLPIVFQYDTTGGNIKIKPKLPPVTSITIQFAPHTSKALKYNPQKKIRLMLHGFYGERQIKYSIPQKLTMGAFSDDWSTVCTNNQYDIYWGGDSFDGAFQSKVDFDKLTTGSLVYNIGIQDPTLKKFDISSSGAGANTPTGAPIPKIVDISGYRYEVLNSIALPLTTLLSKTEAIQKKTTQSGTNPYDFDRTVSYQTHESFAVAYGESVEDIKVVTRTTRTVTLKEIQIASSTSPTPTPVMFPISYSVVIHTYEDMLKTDRSDIDTAYNTTAIGRKKEVISTTWQLYHQENTAFTTAQPGVDCVLVVKSIDYDPNWKFVFYKTSTSIETFSPIGAAGFKSTITSKSINPATGEIITSVQDGQGDSASYISQNPIGPGFEKILVSSGDGEPEMVNIATCNWNDATNYLNNMLKYYNGSFQYTEIKDEKVCDPAGPTGTDFDPPTDIPGNATPNGVIVSINKNITPKKITTTTVYSYYDV